MKTDRIRHMSVTAMLCAVAYLITFVFHFKVGFLTFDFKDAMLVLTSLLFGPLYGVGSALLVGLLEFITISDTGFWGLVMNVLSSATMALVAGLIYKRRRNLGGAVVGLVSAVVATVAVMLLANLFITPIYTPTLTLSDVAAMIPTMLLPFNLCKAVMNAAVVMLLYKPLISALRRTGMIPGSDKAYRVGTASVAVIVSAVAVFAAACVAVVVWMGGSAQFF
ncbi:MAG: ECF transporter S component [Clostridia bacterium]|nr:ECF transporter S component [Clostridia bacterium]